MKTILTSGQKAERKDEIRRDFVSSKILRDRLIEVLTSKILSSGREVTKRESYEVANWSLLQADHIGYKRALEEVISLLSE